MEAFELWEGDCLELLKNVPTGSVDMILCDPPYGTTACKWDTVLDLAVMWGQYERVIKPNGAIAVFGSEPFSSSLRMSNPGAYRYDWYWHKRTAANFVQAKRMPLKTVETVSVFTKGDGLPRYFPIKTPREKPQRVKRAETYQTKNDSIPVIRGDRDVTYTESHPKTLLDFGAEYSSARGLHPNAKPVALLEYLIKTYTLPGETVLDNTMGSGSTGVACKNTGRKFIGIEKDSKYFEIAKTRIFTEFPEFIKQVKV